MTIIDKLLKERYLLTHFVESLTKRGVLIMIYDNFITSLFCASVNGSRKRLEICFLNYMGNFKSGLRLIKVFLNNTASRVFFFHNRQIKVKIPLTQPSQKTKLKFLV